MKKIDCHVHIIGDGSSGSGCELTLRGHFKFFAKILLQQFGLPQSLFETGLDKPYIDTLTNLVDRSSLDAVVILAHEKTRDENGMPIPNFGSMYVPNEYVLKLARENPKFLAGVSIHPARKDAMDELNRCIDGGATLMKCLPNCQNINCNDPRFRPFWERMAEAKLPFLAHTGGEVSLPVYEPKYCDPEIIRLPLECGVTVIGAHCGTNSLFFDTNYTDKFARMLEEFPNLYGDNSGMMTPVRCRHLKKLLKSPYAERMIYGSDMPIPISARWAWMWGFISWKQFRECEAEKNFLERDVMIKRAMGFEDESFVRLSKVLNLQ